MTHNTLVSGMLRELKLTVSDLFADAFKNTHHTIFCDHQHSTIAPASKVVPFDPPIQNVSTYTARAISVRA